MRPDPIRRAIEKAGSVKALAELLGLKPQGISQWRRIPAERAARISAITGIPRHELRPDLWEPPTDTDAAA